MQPPPVDPDPWRDRLTPLQYQVMRQGRTEAPFSGQHLHQHEPGNYHCAGCDQLLFHSYQKYSSGCGWPAFFAQAAADGVTLQPDRRDPDTTELVCTDCGSHLGHLFERGSGGQHFCVNSVCLRFVPSNVGAVTSALSRSGADEASEDPQVLGAVLLSVVAGNASVEKVRELVRRGADLSAKAPSVAGGAAGSTALTWAPTAPVAKLLLDAGARQSDEAPLDGVTALHRAALAGDVERISLLVDADHLSLHRFDYSGRTPLACAAGGGHVSAVELLLQAGSQVDSWSMDYLGTTALMEAVMHDRAETGAVLLAHGADPDLALGPNASPRELAEEKGLVWLSS